MISVDRDMKPTQIRRYASYSIEAVSITLQLPHNTQIQIALLYRSPSAPLLALTSLLSIVLNHISMSCLPCIILGDFKVTGESSIEIFATNNEVLYISSRVHVSNKLTRTKYSY